MYCVKVIVGMLCVDVNTLINISTLESEGT